MSIILQQHICCIIYLRNYCIKHINNMFLFIAIPNKYFSYNYGVLHNNCIGMMLIMFENLQFVFFLINPSIKGFKKVFMGYFIMCRIIIYCASIVLNAFNKMCHSVEFGIIESWSE